MRPLSAARAHVAELLDVSPEEADGVLDLRLRRFTQQELAVLRDELEHLRGRLGR